MQNSASKQPRTGTLSTPTVANSDTLKPRWNTYRLVPGQPASASVPVPGTSGNEGPINRVSVRAAIELKACFPFFPRATRWWGALKGQDCLAEE